MEYIDFLALLDEFAKLYPYIKVPKYSNTEDSAVARVPAPFIKLLKHVLPIIHANIDKFCDTTKQNIVLFGLQPAGGMFTTSEGDEHYCCTLDYYTLDKNTEINTPITYTKTSTMVIDFTTGQVLSESDYCASMATGIRSFTPTFGTIPRDRLRDAWAKIIEHQNLEDAAVKEIKQFYLSTYLKYLSNEPKPALTIPYLAATLSIFNEPRLKSDLRREQPNSVGFAKFRKPNLLTSSGDLDISYSRSSLSSSL